MTSDYLVDSYVSTKPGEPYRLFPFGKIVKNGKVREITPEYAARFRLPHFRPPVKLGSHKDETPAGGHIVGLEVRDDGLYAVPELTDKGASALADGDYRYHSPEVIWDGGGLEDPKTGEIINGPLIVGDALLHTPHLGEGAALYSIQPIVGGESMTEETVNVPTSLWDKYIAPLLTRKEAEPPAPVVEPDQFAAIQSERDEYKAKIEAMEAESAKKARIDAYSAKLSETIIKEGGEIIAGMTDEQAEWVMQQFSALSAQIKANDKLTQELGHNDEPQSKSQKLEAAIKAKQESGLGYVQAFEAVRNEQPDLF